ncbi:hypothetical protein LZZ85_22175 [Terrimonas sp. NA20]|uniref:Uncharacterized protein n=1 Tax=Terrimonas ginsenosidimutans TaxID=2908004 RepID=A0ABS9KXR1_9BACT|nr:hypothetical protein [Terrimonas ginsenosidimutans]MCG2617019.1 hypothetical protein [Terrimonas ginsenosidimutans]
MEENIFDIRFDYEGKNYEGWVNPSEKLNDSGKPVSFHVVLDGVHFGYLSFQNSSWSVNENRPEGLVLATGKEIEKYYSVQNE